MVSKAELDRVRDIALICLDNWGIVFLQIHSPNSGPGPAVNDMLQKAKTCLKEFGQAWTDDVRDAYHLSRPDADRRFGEYLTAVEQIRWIFGFGYVALGHYSEGRIDDAKDMVRVKGDRTFRMPTAADIQAEWAAAVKASTDSADVGKKSKPFSTDPEVIELANFVEKALAGKKGSKEEVEAANKQYLALRKTPPVTDWETLKRKSRDERKLRRQT